MKNNFVLLMFFSFINLFSQNSANSYFVISVTQSDTNRQHPATEYFWIVPFESITENNNIFPLYISNYTNEDIKECVENKPINILTMFSEEDDSIKEEYEKNNLNLMGIINKKKKKFFSIIKKGHAKKNKAEIIFYITPIKGVFCNSKIGLSSGKVFNYEGNIYLPLSKIEFCKELLDSPNYDSIINIDFSDFEFENTH